MTNVLTIIAGLVGGIVIGGLLGFFVPFGIAQFSKHGEALSFIPIVSVPGGAIVGAIVGVILAAGQVKKNRIIEMNRSPEPIEAGN